MADVDLDQLAKRARKAYERGRWRRAALDAWPVLVLAGVATGFGSRPWLAIVVSAMLLGAVVVMGHHGRSWRRAILPGLVAGSLPMVVGLSACHLPHACGGPTCVALCMPLVGAAALLGGMFVAHRSRHASESNRWAELVSAAVLAAVTGALGCVAIGLGGLLGLTVGLTVGTMPALVTRWVR